MKWKKLLGMLLGSMSLTLTLYSCGKVGAVAKVNRSKNTTSELAAAPVDEIFTQPCRCGDLECWRSITDTRAAKQRECAEMAVGSIVPIVGPMWSLMKTAWEIHHFDDYLKDLVKFKSSVLIAKEALKTSTPCLANVSDATSSLITPAVNFEKDVKEFAIGGDPVALASFASIQIGNFSKGLAGFITTLSSCKVNTGDAKFLEAKKLMELNSKVLFKSLVSPVQNLTGDLVAKLNVGNVVFHCGITNLKGSMTLYHNSKCLTEDFAELAKSRNAVSAAVAKAPNRLVGNARYFGCSEAVKSYTWSGGREDRNTCINTCQLESARRFKDEVGRKKAWSSHCSETCTAAYTEGNIFNYIDEGVCKDTLIMNQTKRLYRKLQLTVADHDSFGAFQSEKEKVSAYLQILIDNFDQLDSANDGVVDDIAALVDFQALADNAKADEKLREAARYIGFDSGSYYFKLIDGASVDGSQDGIISKLDLVAFLDELRDYKHDSEYAGS